MRGARWVIAAISAAPRLEPLEVRRRERLGGGHDGLERGDTGEVVNGS